jgi:hypothetical protein
VSAYVPVDWTDGVDPVNAANLNHMEDRIELLDTHPVIPTPLPNGQWLTVAGGALVWAPAPAGGGVDYKGAWGAGTPYASGDVANYNGVDYLAVNPSTGQTPPLAAPASIPLVTALPGSPVDGQEIILVDSLTAPTYQWRLRYVAAKASNRWIYIGGRPLYAEVPTQEPTTSTVYTNLATIGPSLTPPVSGDYMVEHGCTVVGGGVGFVHHSYDIGATGAVDADSAQMVPTNSAGGNSIMRAQAKALVAAAALVSKYKCNSANTGSFRFRWMRLTPIAVGG